MNPIHDTGDALLQAFETLWLVMAKAVPGMAAAVLVLVAGWYFARLVRSVARRVLRTVGFDRVAERTAITRVLVHANIPRVPSDLLSLVLFWLLFAGFVVIAADTIGLTRVSEMVGQFASYLPRVLAAIAVLMLGLLFAEWLRNAVLINAERLGVDQAHPLATILYGLSVVIVISLAIAQLDLETTLLDQVISIVLLVFGLGSAIAFGYGARNVAANVLAGSYVRDLFEPGDQVEVGDVAGTIDRIDTVKTVIVTADGTRVTVPNDRLVSDVVRTRRGPRA